MVFHQLEQINLCKELKRTHPELFTNPERVLNPAQKKKKLIRKINKLSSVCNKYRIVNNLNLLIDEQENVNNDTLKEFYKYLNTPRIDDQDFTPDFVNLYNIEQGNNFINLPELEPLNNNDLDPLIANNIHEVDLDLAGFILGLF